VIETVIRSMQTVILPRQNCDPGRKTVILRRPSPSVVLPNRQTVIPTL